MPRVNYHFTRLADMSDSLEPTDLPFNGNKTPIIKN
jgi:hypothetical protein